MVTGFFSNAVTEAFPKKDSKAGDTSAMTFNDDTLNQSKLGQISTNESNIE